MYCNHQIRGRPGFTLIEVLMYVAFLTLLLGTLLGMAYQTIAGVGQINKKIVLQQEADFILRKIGWALNGARGFTILNPNDLAIVRFASPANVEFKSDGNYVDVNTGSGFAAVNSQNTRVSNFVFIKTQNSSQPDRIQADFDIYCTNCAASQLEHFQMVKYLRIVQ